VFDEGSQLLAERLGVLFVQIDLTLRTGEPEPQRLICWAPVQIVF
jgi:hypothetical protein